MPIKVHHWIAHSGDAIHNTQNLARDITERLLPGIRMLDQSSLKQEAGVQVVEIEVNKSQPSMVKIVSRPSIISEVIRSRFPHRTYTLTNFTIKYQSDRLSV
jgi:hypothetical protein